MNLDIAAYNNAHLPDDKAICDALGNIIDQELTEAESKIWHAHPVWFLEGNPIVGYCKRKAGIVLMFWSGASFEEEKLKPRRGKFKDASITYTSVDQIDAQELKTWLAESRTIQWDYKNLVKRKGMLEKLGDF